MTLDYRMPDTGEHRVLRVVGELQSEEVIDWALALAKLAAGVPLTLLPALFVTMYFFPWRAMEAFWPVFSGVCAAIVPAMLWLERRERQDYLWEATSEPFWMWMLDLLLFGPRLLWGVYDQVHHEPVDQETLVLAARVTVEMLDQDQTIEVRQLLSADRSAPELRRALRYLEHRGWVCISRCRSRVWLTTSVRSQFAELR